MKKIIWRCHHFTHVYQKSWSFGACFLRYGMQQTEFFAILGHFLPFYPTNNQVKKLERRKRAPGDIILLHMRTINDNMMHDSWNLSHDGQHFLSFWAIFYPFISITTWKKMKKWENLLHKCNINDDRSYDGWLLRYGAEQIHFFVILDHFRPCYPPNNPKNQHFEEMQKQLEILSFYVCVP